MVQLVTIIFGSILRFVICAFCGWLVSKGVLEKIPDSTIISHAVDQLTGWAGVALVILYSIVRTILLKKYGTLNPFKIQQQKANNEKTPVITSPVPPAI